MESLPKKLSICYEAVLKGGMNDNLEEKFPNEPLNKLLNNYEEIEIILRSGKDKIYQFLYYIWKTIYDILYNEDKIIDLNEIKSANNKLSELFYLDLLIMYKSDITNFKCNLEFIENINNLQKINKDEIYKKMLRSKIIIDLINIYKNNEEIVIENDSLNDINESNTNLIKENLSVFNELNLGEDLFENEKIDEIYSIILDSLIKQNKFKDFDYIKKILEQLNYEDIYLTDIMLENLKSTLNSSEDFINIYKISNIFELINDNTKINFYYILYKYILKSPFYIYQIDFLLFFRKIIISSLKENSTKIQKLLNDPANVNNEKIKYIIQSFTASDYYLSEKYFNRNDLKNEKNNKNSNINNKNSSDNIKSASNITTVPKSISKNESSVQLDEFSKNIEATTLNNFYFEIYFNENKNNSDGRDNNNDNNKNDNLYKNKMNSIHKINVKKITSEEIKKNFERFKKILEEFDKCIYQLEKQSNTNFVLQFQFERKGDNKNSDLYNITCKIILSVKENESLKELKSFKAYNILETGILKTQAFLYLKKTITFILKKTFPQLSLNNSIISISSTSTSSSGSIYRLKGYNITSFYKFKNIEKYLNKDENYYEIISLEKILFQHAGAAEFIIEITNNYFLSYGFNYDIFLYDNNFKKVDEYSIHSKLSDNVNNNIQISKNDTIICTNKGVDIFTFNNTQSKIDKIQKIINSPSIFFFKPANNDYILATRNQFKILKSLNQYYKEENITLAGGIQIGENDFAFTSNSNLPNGKDKIYFFNSNTAELLDGIIEKEYSFTVSQHSMELISNKKGEKTFLLCACTKYKKGQENGIVVINLENYDNDIFKTGGFEVFCFCPIYIIIEISSKQKEIKPYSTNYFLAGGFDTEMKKGAIKLFRLIIEEKKDDSGKNKSHIEFVQDIVFENKKVKKFKNSMEENIRNQNGKKKLEYDLIYFTGFQRNISCITQSKKTGKLLITCWDGNVYLFSAPNISFYLNQDCLSVNLL